MLGAGNLYSWSIRIMSAQDVGTEYAPGSIL